MESIKMSTKKRKSRKKKQADVTVSKTEGIKILEPVTDEESTEVKQSFIDPATITAETPFTPEEVANLEEEPTNMEEIQFAVAQLPTPLIVYTQRQMGEEFMPEYSRIRHKLRRLVGLTNGLP